MPSMNDIALGLVMLSLAPLGGCADPAGDVQPETVAASLGAFVSENAMIPNAMIPNALAPSALAPSVLAAIADPGTAGDLSRMFLRYAVSCALDGTQAFNFRWLGGSGAVQEEVYPGAMGLAPEWAHGPLGARGQALVSACLAARTNYYGTPVALSLRGGAGALPPPGGAEIAANPYVEGAFWGNAFSPTPSLRACYVGGHAGNSRAWKRDCANGHLDGQGGKVPCGIIEIVGDCDELCDVIDAEGQFYGACNDPELGRVSAVITAALPPAAVPASSDNLRMESAGPAAVTVGACNTVARTLTIANTGGTTAAKPIVSDALPSGLAFVSATAPAGGACGASGAMVVCALPDLPPGASTSVVIQARPTVSGRAVSDSAVVASAMAESDTTDNRASTSTQLLAPPSAPWERMTAAFDHTPIAKGSSIWFHVEARGVEIAPAQPTTVWMVGGQVTFSAQGVAYSVPAPGGRLTFDPAAAAATTSFNERENAWSTVVPASYAGSSSFLAGVSFTAPVDLPGGISDVTWSGHLVSNRPGVSVTWRLGAALYSWMPESYSLLSVRPVDAAAQRAGTLDGLLSFARAGGCRGGICGTSAQGVPEVQTACQ